MQKKIVIIEDELILQELHMHYVTNLGHEVIACFQTGSEAIDFFKNNTADLILMDIRLEGDMNGIETAEKIQEISNVPLVYVSANNNDNLYNKALGSSSMKGYLSKPLSPKELDDVIKSITNITDSINYAYKIQKQLFAKEEELNSIFKDYIYINRPKDIVSGDFCFISEKNNDGEIIIALGDCTGHGVPGALLSIICYNLLKNLTDNTSDLKTIISQIYTRLKSILSPTLSLQVLNDSLDISVFKIKDGSKVIEITGAKRELLFYDSQEREIKIIKLKMKNEDLDSAPLIKIEFHDDDVFYFYSDGITDQFGGNFDKKLTRKRLKNFLLSESLNTDMKLKQYRLNIFLRKWQGRINQTDDMIFLGIRPSLYL